MSDSISSLPLRAVLGIDAATCAVMGLTLVVAAQVIAALTALPVDLLVYAGIALLPIAAFLAFLASRSAPPTVGVWVVVLGNVLWVAASLLLLLGGWVAPNVLGYAFVIVQAIAVATLAWLEYAALNGASARLQTS